MARSKTLSTVVPMVPFAVKGLEGQEVTVIIRLQDGQEVETTGTFDSAEWNADWQEVPSCSWDVKQEFVVAERRFTLRLRQTREARRRITR